MASKSIVAGIKFIGDVATVDNEPLLKKDIKFNKNTARKRIYLYISLYIASYLIKIQQGKELIFILVYS